MSDLPLRERLRSRDTAASRATPSARARMLATGVLWLAVGAAVASVVAVAGTNVGGLLVAAAAVAAALVLLPDGLRRTGIPLGPSARAHRDSLTGLLDRSAFEVGFELELERARRSAAPLSLIVGDLDRFRRIEDLYGRAAGDAALERVARAIDGVKRGFDSAARVGGEEYALLAPDCDEHGGYMLAERVRTEVDGAVAGPHGRLTISFGVATFPFHGQTAESLLRAADQASTQRSDSGRNRTVISSAEEPGLLAPSPARAKRPVGGSRR